MAEILQESKWQKYLPIHLICNQIQQFSLINVEKNKWSYKYVQAFQDYMPKKGSLFNGGEYVTREEFAASLVKASGQKAADSYTITNYSFQRCSKHF